MAESVWALIRSLYNMLEELRKENTRLRTERDTAKDQINVHLNCLCNPGL